MRIGWLTMIQILRFPFSSPGSTSSVDRLPIIRTDIAVGNWPRSAMMVRGMEHDELTWRLRLAGLYGDWQGCRVGSRLAIQYFSRSMCFSYFLFLSRSRPQKSSLVIDSFLLFQYQIHFQHVCPDTWQINFYAAKIRLSLYIQRCSSISFLLPISPFAVLEYLFRFRSWAFPWSQQPFTSLFKGPYILCHISS